MSLAAVALTLRIPIARIRRRDEGITVHGLFAEILDLIFDGLMKAEEVCDHHFLPRYRELLPMLEADMRACTPDHVSYFAVDDRYVPLPGCLPQVEPGGRLLLPSPQHPDSILQVQVLMAGPIHLAVEIKRGAFEDVFFYHYEGRGWHPCAPPYKLLRDLEKLAQRPRHFR